MTLVSDIINDAYRESNLTNLNGAPTDAQVTEGLRLLVRIVSSVYGNEVGDNLQNLPLGNVDVVAPGGFPPNYPNNWFLPLNCRAVLNYDSPQTLYLHPDPQDGSIFAYVDENSSPLNVTLNANGRRIEGATTYPITLSRSNRAWIYDAPTGNWNVISPITLTDPMPFPPEFDDYFVISLAKRLNPRYTVTLAPESVDTLKSQARKLKARYNQIIQVGSERALVVTPGVRKERGYFYGYGYGNDTFVFNRGYPFLG